MDRMIGPPRHVPAKQQSESEMRGTHDPSPPQGMLSAFRCYRVFLLLSLLFKRVSMSAMSWAHPPTFTITFYSPPCPPSLEMRRDPEGVSSK